MNTPASHPRSTGLSVSGRRRGFTLIELIVVLVVMMVLAQFMVYPTQRALEQSRTDIAVAGLRAIWTAQRLYYIENQTYASSISTLINGGLLSNQDFNQTSNDSARHYYFMIDAGATSSSFTASAWRYDRRDGALTNWNGNLSINQDGTVDGFIYRANESNSFTPSNVFR
jgi:prepilin-type N-terminal cleavage/methylation domain-containing protein